MTPLTPMPSAEYPKAIHDHTRPSRSRRSSARPRPRLAVDEDWRRAVGALDPEIVDLAVRRLRRLGVDPGPVALRRRDHASRVTDGGIGQINRSIVEECVSPTCTATTTSTRAPDPAKAPSGRSARCLSSRSRRAAPPPPERRLTLSVVRPAFSRRPHDARKDLEIGRKPESRAAPTSNSSTSTHPTTHAQPLTTNGD